MSQVIRSGRPVLPRVYTVEQHCLRCGCVYRCVPRDRIVVIWPVMRSTCPQCNARVEMRVAP